MITSGIYNYVNILDKAADAANLRNELLTNNIANVSTPNYKRKDLDFESVLQGELAGEKNLSKAVKRQIRILRHWMHRFTRIMHRFHIVWMETMLISILKRQDWRKTRSSIRLWLI